MKEAHNDHTQNQLDLLLFEYLEGGLNEAQKKELEEKLAMNPDLQAEVDCWKESYMEEGFYDTTELESVLLNINAPVKSWYSHASLNIFLLLLVTGMFSFLPLNTNEEKHTGQHLIDLPTPVLAVGRSHETAKPNKPAVIPEADSEKPVEKASVKNLASETVAGVSSEKEFTKLNFPKLTPLPARTEISLTGSYIPAEKIRKVIAKSTTTPTISRKQERRVRRMKRKAAQERMAREFMKGDRPYVVPLDTKNF